MIDILIQFKDSKELLIIYSLAFLVSILIGMCFHEYAHARMAYNCGDDTARLAGRMTLNPIAHIDLLGAIAFFLVGFGWAKPVPVNSLKFKQYRKGIFLTSIAGVLMNFTICFFAVGFYAFFSKMLILFEEMNFWFYVVFFFQVASHLIAIVNLNLCIFNLLPFRPLDGFNVLQSVTKGTNKFVNFLKNYGQIILIVLVISRVFAQGMLFLTSHILEPITQFWYLIIFGV